MTILECVVALLITSTALLSLMFMQPLAWKGASKSDYLGRAEAILQRELESDEGAIRWGTPPTSNTAVITCADASGNTVACTSNTKVFNITYTPTIPAGTIATYLINVRVIWTGSANGITNSMIVSR